MRKIILIAALIGAASVPALASAQAPPPGCVRQDNSAAGTVIGAIGGAALGSAIAGRGDKTAGAVIGGVGGALIGN